MPRLRKINDGETPVPKDNAALAPGRFDLNNISVIGAAMRERPRATRDGAYRVRAPAPQPCPDYSTHNKN